jgi:hypothetical protein
MFARESVGSHRNEWEKDNYRERGRVIFLARASYFDIGSTVRPSTDTSSKEEGAG